MAGCSYSTDVRDLQPKEKGSMNRGCIMGAAMLLIASCIFLGGCGGSAPAVSSDAASGAHNDAAETEASGTEENFSSDNTASGTAAKEETELPPEPGMVRSPITNEWIDEDKASKRPIAVMYPTDRKAQPQYGLDRVGVFYEILEEGSMSRQMGILEDWEELGRIGNIRSIRDYFIYEALEWDAVLVHFGGPEIFVRDLLCRKDVDNLNGVDGAMGSSYGAFYRLPAGSNSVHSAFTDGKHILAGFEKAGFEREYRKEYYDKNRWSFAPASSPVSLENEAGAVSAETLDMSGCYPITKTVLRYNSEDGLYYRNIYGTAQCDAVTGEQLSFSNVLIENAVSGSRGGGYLYYHVLDEGHDGYYLTGGKMIHVRWSKTSDYGTTRFYKDNGEEITLNTGRTMVFVTREGLDHFTADGVRYDL